MPIQDLSPAPAARPEASPKRQLVLDAARTLFLADGFGAVSMEAVARRAGVSKATLYAHFASKEALFATMMGAYSLPEQVSDELLSQPADDLPTVLEAVGRTMLRFLLAEGTMSLIRIAIAESARFPELGRTYFARGPARSVERLAHWLAGEQAAGRIRADADPSVAADQFVALLRSGLFLRAALGVPPPPGEADIDRTVAAAVDTWLRAFAPRRP